MRRLTPLLARLVAIFAAIVVCGGQWAALQVVAWSGMAITYSATSGLKAGLQKTFDGDHPCPMCLVVKAGQEEEQKSSPKMSTKAAKFEAPLASDLSAPIPQQLSCKASFTQSDIEVSVRTERPPVPPPRLA